MSAKQKPGKAPAALRPAAVLRAESAGQLPMRCEGIDRAAEAIEAAHARGERETTQPSFSEYAVNQLRLADYHVRLNRRAPVELCDTHTIKW